MMTPEEEDLLEQFFVYGRASPNRKAELIALIEKVARRVATEAVERAGKRWADREELR